MRRGLGTGDWGLADRSRTNLQGARGATSPQSPVPSPRTLEPLDARMQEAHWACMPAGLRRAIGARTAWVGDAFLTAGRASDSLRLNRVVGLGSRRRPSAARLGEIVAAYREAGVGRFSVMLAPGAHAAAARRLLRAHDFAPHDRHAKLVRETASPPPAETTLRVRQIGRAQAGAFARILGETIGMPESRQLWIAATVGAPGFHHFLAFAGRTPAATGLLYVDGRWGTLAFGTTRAAYRGRGAQTALIAERVRRAAALGCTHVMAVTDQPRRGRPSVSFRNSVRCGFRPAYAREVWVWGEHA